MPDEVLLLAVLSLGSITALGFGLIRSINRHVERKWGGRQGLAEGPEPLAANHERSGG